MHNFLRFLNASCDRGAVWCGLLVITWFFALSISGLAQQPVGGSDKGQAPVEKASVVGTATVTRPVDNAASVDPAVALRSVRVIFVHSASLLVGGSVVEEKLQRRPEFQQLGLVITRDEKQADLILELRHDLFTMYVYTAILPRSQIVVASGKLSSLGGTVAGKVAERFLKQLVKARRT